MASDYQAIRRNNERRYGTDIGRIGPMLLADRYDDRTHFIFELLQNAEDALGRREGWKGSRAVSFRLAEATLRIEHFGLPFDEADVRGICGIAESTKDLTAIGRFGIGFKSVYAVTSRPEVHSSAEAFAIESFVWPDAVPPIDRDPDATVILIPLDTSEQGDRDELARGLGRLDPLALLFLRQIEEIRWSVEGGRSGLYLRESRDVGADVRRVTVIGQEHGQPDVAEECLIFSRAVSTDDGRHAGYVELAFSLDEHRESEQERIARLARSPLVVFFPTVLETHLGFLVQGPYQRRQAATMCPAVTCGISTLCARLLHCWDKPSAGCATTTSLTRRPCGACPSTRQSSGSPACLRRSTTPRSRRSPLMPCCHVSTSGTCQRPMLDSGARRSCATCSRLPSLGCSTTKKASLSG